MESQVRLPPPTSWQPQSLFHHPYWHGCHHILPPTLRATFRCAAMCLSIISTSIRKANSSDLGTPRQVHRVDHNFSTAVLAWDIMLAFSHACASARWMTDVFSDRPCSTCSSTVTCRESSQRKKIKLYVAQIEATHHQACRLPGAHMAHIRCAKKPAIDT